MAIVLVTGGSGFIGCHLVRKLEALGHEVRVLVRPTSDLRRLRGTHADLVLGDVRDAASLPRAVREVDYVLHLAAVTMPTSPAAFHAVNATGTANLLAAVRAAAPRLARFVLVSSQAAGGPNPGQAALTEEDEPRPVSCYGRSKVEAEDLCRASGLPFAIVRPVAVYGPAERDLSRSWGLIDAGFRPRVGLRAGAISCVHVDDLVEGICAAAFEPAGQGETFFLAHPEAQTAWSLVDRVGRALGQRFGLPVPVPLLLLRLVAPVAEWTAALTGARPAVTRDKALEISQPRWVASPRKAMDMLGWVPHHDLASGLARTVPAWQAERRRARLLAGDTPRAGLARSILFTFLIGSVIETTSAIGHFYRFEPWWALFVILVFGFGIGLGAIAWFTRGWSGIARYLLGSAAATSVELLAAADRLPLIDWTFAPGWPLGIRDDYVRALVVGQAGGVIVLLGGAIARGFWTMRQRTGSQA